MIAVKPFIQSFQSGKATVFTLIDESQLRIILWPGIAPAAVILKHCVQKFRELWTVGAVAPGLFHP